MYGSRHRKSDPSFRRASSFVNMAVSRGTTSSPAARTS